MTTSATEDVFTRIWLQNGWGDAESVSGPGSTVYRTRLLRPRITELVRELKIGTLLDLPCGDFNWMRLTDLSSSRYIGADIVGRLIAQNKARHARSDRQFLRIDMLRDPLPKADLILCRDALVHFSFADIKRALCGMQASGATHLLVTTFTDHPVNEDVVTGGWRPLNLGTAPFNFPPPLLTIWDGPRHDGSYPDKVLALYRLDMLSAQP